jgi:hypothetical protein
MLTPPWPLVNLTCKIKEVYSKLLAFIWEFTVLKMYKTVILSIALFKPLFIELATPVLPMFVDKTFDIKTFLMKRNKIEGMTYTKREECFTILTVEDPDSVLLKYKHFSSPELKALVSCSDRPLSIVCLSVC